MYSCTDKKTVFIAWGNEYRLNGVGGLVDVVVVATFFRNENHLTLGMCSDQSNVRKITHGWSIVSLNTWQAHVYLITIATWQCYFNTPPAKA